METENKDMAMEAEEKSEAAEAAEDTAQQPVKVSSKRIKKTERREAKAARKAANKIEEKKSRPNNLLIAVMIFGVVIAMFAFVLGYNYFSKPANIEKYLEENGGKDTYGSMQVDAYTTAEITAKGNSMNIKLTAAAEEKEIRSEIKKYYKGEEGQEQLKQLAAYFLTTIKPETRAFSADATASISLNDKELNSVKITYKEAKELMEPEDEHEHSDSEESEEAADAEDAGDAEDDGGSEEDGE